MTACELLLLTTSPERDERLSVSGRSALTAWLSLCLRVHLGLWNEFQDVATPSTKARRLSGTCERVKR